MKSCIYFDTQITAHQVIASYTIAKIYYYSMHPGTHIMQHMYKMHKIDYLVGI